MNTDMTDKIALVVILSDGIRGHLFQSRGIARWIEALCGAKVIELEVPLYRGWKKAWILKAMGKILARGDRLTARHWLDWTGDEGQTILDSYRLAMDGLNVDGERTMVISTGSSAASFCLALARIMGGKSCTVMTPSVIGTDPFDYAVVPSHDGEPERALITLGAPNSITHHDMEKSAEALFSTYPPKGEGERWGLLIGGDDQNYSVDPSWADMTVGVLLRIAEEKGVSLYITTSRRTSEETEDKIKEVCGGSDSVAMVLLASKDDLNPVPGILGGCQRVFCTEDSVSMISEAATSGTRTYLLRVGRQRGWRKVLQDITVKLVEWKALSEKHLWGTPRFDMMIDRFKERGLLTEMPSDVMAWRPMLDRPAGLSIEFNEAQRAARWILENWR